jgi:hypothetical protein
MVREVMANTEDVGERFAEEARRIHYGEADERNIRGQASREETEALLDEGIAVMPLPLPKALKGPAIRRPPKRAARASPRWGAMLRPGKAGSAHFSP